MFRVLALLAGPKNAALGSAYASVTNATGTVRYCPRRAIVVFSDIVRSHGNRSLRGHISRDAVRRP